MIFRVGFGFDVHQLKEGLPLTLGGVQLEHRKGALGHSDADVLLHALCDALLGAAGMRDIGFHFPDTHSEFKGIDSKILLSRVIQTLKDSGFSVVNADTTLVLESPKINPHIEQMKSTISPILGIEPSDLGIKATTNEKMGYIGREEGVCAYAVVMISKN